MLTTKNFTPLVSVIICNYNYGRFISQAIDSVLNQTYKNFELIVVDDGSTDNSRQVIESYNTQIIALFQKNAGQGAAFNTGIAEAKGELICFLDSDDYYREDKLEKVVAEFTEHPEWVQISHGRTSVDREGNIIGKDPTFFSEGDVTPLLLKWGRYAWAITSALCYRRSVINKILPIPQSIRAADTYLTAAVPFYGEVGCINEPLMFYRKHGNNQRSQINKINILLKERQDTARCINQTAIDTGKNQIFDINNDADYRSVRVMQDGKGSWRETITILGLTIKEARDIGQSPKDTLERILRRCICAFSPDEGKIFLRFGPKRYLKYRLTGKQPKNFELT
ncbi:MAG: glycosyltransferase [Pleurocapsa sp. MO_226.B13]|nr:glycosyltransferase [Pleurocapsa sp. MO_226.B13]